MLLSFRPMRAIISGMDALTLQTFSVVQRVNAISRVPPLPHADADNAARRSPSNLARSTKIVPTVSASARAASVKPARAK